MDITIVLILITLHLFSGWYSVKLIKKRDIDAPPAVDLIIVLHGIISLITTLTIQNLLFPGEDGNPNKVFLKDGMTLDLSNPEHKEIYEKLKDINK